MSEKARVACVHCTPHCHTQQQPVLVLQCCVQRLGTAAWPHLRWTTVSHVCPAECAEAQRRAHAAAQRWWAAAQQQAPAHWLVAQLARRLGTAAAAGVPLPTPP